MKQVCQKDIKHVEELWKLEFSIQKISDITKRTWSTIKAIIDSGFNLDKYKRITQAARKGKKLTFRPFNEQNSPGPVKVQEIPVEAVEASNSLSNMDDVLNHMWEIQQNEAKEIVKKAERDEAIHKIRNGLQKISEGLGALL
jgi:hypothetical protein